MQVWVSNTLNGLDDIFHIEHTFDDHRSNWELENILKDQHGTFEIFKKSYDFACEKILQKQFQYSVPLYIQDIRNPDFSKLIELHTSKWIQNESIMLEIKPDDYGIFDTIALDNLVRAKKAGFWVSMYNGFVEKDGTLEATENLDRMNSMNIIPNIIYLGDTLFRRLKNNSVRLSSQVANIFQKTRIANSGREELEIVKKESRQNINSLLLPLFQESRVEKEGIFELDGKLHANEWLIRFAKEIPVNDGLEVLKNIGATKYLLKFIIEDAIIDIRNGKRRSVNIFMKDLDHPHFQEFITTLLNNALITREQRKFLIFEIVEDTYGIMNKRVIENIRFIQERLWSKIAIDDLYYDNSDKNMSVDIMQILFDSDIMPDYIKMDGKLVESVLDDSIQPQHLRHIKELIAQLSIQEHAPTFIFEWIKSTDDALKIESILQSYKKDGANKRLGLGKFLFQWRSIKEWKFWTWYSK